MRSYPILLVLACIHLVGYSQEYFPETTFYRAKDSLVFERAFTYYDEGKFEEALETLKSLPQKTYGNDPAWTRLVGYCYIKLDKREEALTIFGALMLSHPQYIGIYYDRANAYLSFEMYPQAAADFSAFWIHFPEEREVKYNLPFALAKGGNPDRAIDFLNNLDQRDTTLNVLLANIYADYKGDYTKAIEVLEVDLKNYPSAFEPRLDLIVYCYYNNLLEKAYALVKAILLERPTYGYAFFLKGTIEEELGDEGKAQESYDLARKYGYTWEETDFLEEDY